MGSAKCSYYLVGPGQMMDQGSLTRIGENVKIAANILEQTAGTFITKDNQHTVLTNLENPAGTLIPSGRQTLFVWQFSTSKSKSLVLKPYTLSFEEIILHCLSIEKFKKLFHDRPFATDSGQITVKMMDVYAVGSIYLETTRFPFIIQEFSQGIIIQDAKIGHEKLSTLHLSTLFREIAKYGFHIDPFPTNWRVIPPNSLSADYCFEYLDLLFTQELATLQRIEGFIESLGKSNKPC